MEKNKNEYELDCDRKLEILKDLLHEFKVLTRDDERRLKDLEIIQAELKYKLSIFEKISEDSKDVDLYLSGEFSQRADKLKAEITKVENKIQKIKSSHTAVKMIKNEINGVELE